MEDLKVAERNKEVLVVMARMRDRAETELLQAILAIGSIHENPERLKGGSCAS